MTMLTSGGAHKWANDKEEEDFGDIVFLNVGDSYELLIGKLREAMRWTIEHRNPVYVAKFDDDTYVNVPVLLQDLQQHPRERLYYGYFMRKVPIQRESTSKNNEPKLPGYDTCAAYLLIRQHQYSCSIRRRIHGSLHTTRLHPPAPYTCSAVN